jgi:hypothetical protein
VNIYLLVLHLNRHQSRLPVLASPNNPCRGQVQLDNHRILVNRLSSLVRWNGIIQCRLLPLLDMGLYRNDTLPHSVRVKVNVEFRMAVVEEKRAVAAVHTVRVRTCYGGVVPACLPSRAYDILSRRKNR